MQNYTMCIQLHTVCKSTHWVYYYTLCVKLHTMCGIKTTFMITQRCVAFSMEKNSSHLKNFTLTSLLALVTIIMYEKRLLWKSVLNFSRKWKLHLTLCVNCKRCAKVCRKWGRFSSAFKNVRTVNSEINKLSRKCKSCVARCKRCAKVCLKWGSLSPSWGKLLASFQLISTLGR